MQQVRGRWQQVRGRWWSAAAGCGVSAAMWTLGGCGTQPGGQAADASRLAVGDASGPLHVREIVRETAAGPVRGWAATVNLMDPRVEVVVTGPVEPRTDDPAKTEGRLRTTLDWALDQRLDVAVNANFFSWLGGVGADGKQDKRAASGTGQPAEVIGLALSAGRLVSAPRVGEGPAGAAPDPALVVGEGWARAARVGADQLAGVLEGVAGVGGSTSESGGTLLVEDGVNRGATARVDPARRHPRTAAGVSADGRRLVLVVVDGRQPGWSAGMSLPELAELMIELGCDDAVNLDGGGSSSFVWLKPDGTRVVNRPSDRAWRPVAVNFGVRIRRGVGDAGGRLAR